MKIITFTCDIYTDIVPAYHYLWQQHWPDCPYELVYVTNSKPLGIDATVYYMKGKDIEYGRRLRRFVSEHCQDNALGLFMMGDYLIRSIDIPLVERARQACEKGEASHCRLAPKPHPTLDAPSHLNDEFGQIDKKTRYALSLQPGIWRPQDLARCVRDTENPWHCETHGTGRVKRIPGMFLCTRRPAIMHHNYYKKRRPFGPIWVKENVPEEYWTDAARKAKR